MNYVEFCEDLVNEIKKYIGNDGDVRILPTLKNNGVVYDGIIIKTEKSRISPTIYIEPYYDMYKEGTAFSEIVGMIENCYEKNSNKQFDIDYFTDFESVKDGIIFKLVHRKMNDILLADVPNRDWNDLSICYCYVLKEFDSSEATILIRNEHMKMWGVDEKTLFEVACRNTPNLMPDKLCTMGTILSELISKNNSDCDLCMDDIEFCDNMYVLTNEKAMFGATVILYTKYLKEIADKHKCGVYIIPSSIHEVILMPQNEYCDERAIREMIKEVNYTEVLCEERLSDNLYYYNPDMEAISIVAG